MGDKHFGYRTGVSDLPQKNHAYRQEPYQEIDKATYDQLVKELPKNVDWKKLSDIEHEDNTVGSQTLACAAGACEIVDLTSDTVNTLDIPGE